MIDNLTLSFPDFQLNQVIDPEQFDINNAELVAKINEILDLLNDGNTDPTGLRADLEALIANVLQKDNLVSYTPTTDYHPATKKYADTVGANLNGSRQVILDAHKVSSDHDGRYYTETEIDAFEAAMQVLVNKNAADIVTVNNLIATLNNTYSTDLERINAINQVVADYEAADSSLTTLISAKANTSDVYTKAQIDAMTLGSYKFGFFKNRVDVTTLQTTVAVGITEWIPENDPLIVYIGGIYQTEGVDYSVDSVNKTITNLSALDWEDVVLDFFVIKNVRVVAPEDYADGSMISPGTVQRTAFAPAITAELDGLRTDTDTNTGNISTIQSDLDTKVGTDTINATVLVGDWIASGEGDYPYKAEITWSPITGLQFCLIEFPRAQATLVQDAEIAPQSDDSSGSTIIYAKNIPTGTLNPIIRRVVL